MRVTFVSLTICGAACGVNGVPLALHIDSSGMSISRSPALRSADLSASGLLDPPTAASSTFDVPPEIKEL